MGSVLAMLAWPPSPMSPGNGVYRPAPVVIVPSGPTRRTILKSVSATHRAPSGVRVIPRGPRSRAAVAGPPSPWPAVAAPVRLVLTTVVMIPSVPTRRTVSPKTSTSHQVPSGATVRPRGPSIFAAVAGPPSPKLVPVPPPATVVIVPSFTRRTRSLVVSATRMAPSGRTATAVGLLSWAAVAAPPSPVKPAVPFPATVVMVPSRATRRIRWSRSSAM